VQNEVGAREGSGGQEGARSGARWGGGSCWQRLTQKGLLELCKDALFLKQESGWERYLPRPFRLEGPRAEGTSDMFLLGQHDGL
jgi:hypothetical protein